MTTTIPLPVGSYATRDLRASCRRLVNTFSEVQPQTSEADSKQDRPPVQLRRAPGINSFANDGTLNPPRGMRTMAGITYVVIGPTLYSMNSAGALTQIATGISGSGVVRIADNTQCLFILLPGTSVAYTYCPNGPGFSLYTNPTFLSYGAVDVWFIDTFFVFLALNGRIMYNDDGQFISGVGPPTFTTAGVFPREFGTDLFVGMAVDHREILMFGILSSEGYVNVGTATGSPFTSAPDSFLQIGCHPDAALSIALQDQSVFWVANDRTVRRRNGQTPTRVSNSGIEAILETANLKGCYALTPSIAGHPWWVLTMPAEQRTIAYDSLTTEWFELSSRAFGNWRPLTWYNAFGKQLVGDSVSGQIGFLDTTIFNEFNTGMTTVLTTQPVYDRHNRVVHRRLELIVTAGGEPDPNLDPQVTLHISDDGGFTFRSMPLRSLGRTGDRQHRAVWFNLGQSRERVYQFQISATVPQYSIDIQAELEGGKW